MTPAGETGPMDQRAALIQVVDHVKHRPLCRGGGGNDWKTEMQRCARAAWRKSWRRCDGRPRSRERLPLVL
jgi:hypothetical protein